MTARRALIRTPSHDGIAGGRLKGSEERARHRVFLRSRHGRIGGSVATSGRDQLARAELRLAVDAVNMLGSQPPWSESLREQAAHASAISITEASGAGETARGHWKKSEKNRGAQQEEVQHQDGHKSTPALWESGDVAGRKLERPQCGGLVGKSGPGDVVARWGKRTVHTVTALLGTARMTVTVVSGGPTRLLGGFIHIR